ncbi:dihydropyrimidinase family protein [Dorcoceras hygrometricum]|nr:dihydropyrimidinase family protein [Dorcoceras hygrometricum]
MDSSSATQNSHCKSLLSASVFAMIVMLLPFAQSNQYCDARIGYGELVCGVDSTYSPKILIKGGTVVNAHRQEVADVYVEDGIIVAVQSDIMVEDGVKIIDASGKYVMPGGIDPHTHLAMEFMGTETVDDFFSGQAAALAGGTTMHIDFVIPVNGSLLAGFDSYVKKAERSCMDYGFHMAITKWDNSVAREMELMVKDKGINSFKFFMAYKGSFMINDELLLEGFKKCKSLGAMAMVHAENGDAVFEGQKRMIELGITGPEGHALSRPPMLEGEATGRAIRLAGFVNTPLFVMSPPIRAAGHSKALQAALSTGILQLVGTDHCTFNSTQKTLGINDFRKIPNGVNGLEERMHIVWDTMVASGKTSASDFVRVTSTECARIFNIYPRKGAILVGSDADIIILNPNSSFEISSATHHSRSDTNVYEGRKGKGKVEVTIAGGKIVWESEELKVVPGSGKYVEMPPYNYFFDGIEKADLDYLSSLKAPVKRSIQTS